ncbi:MAG: hypothetical protein WDN02_15265 [Methylovirgula sp.]|uniref:hypothetical protein n=1 Tax=Methylovirgula sp. TaxID=1978224 RepID=UPI0030763739
MVYLANSFRRRKRGRILGVIEQDAKKWMPVFRENPAPNYSESIALYEFGSFKSGSPGLNFKMSNSGKPELDWSKLTAIQYPFRRK